ncbi:TPA: hypothetical protein ACKFM7_002781 [Burkholderia contaminans]
MASRTDSGAGVSAKATAAFEASSASAASFDTIEFVGMIRVRINRAGWS